MKTLEKNRVVYGIESRREIKKRQKTKIPLVHVTKDVASDFEDGSFGGVIRSESGPKARDKTTRVKVRAELFCRNPLQSFRQDTQVGYRTVGSWVVEVGFAFFQNGRNERRFPSRRKDARGKRRVEEICDKRRELI